MSGLNLRPTKRDGTGLNLVYVSVYRSPHRGPRRMAVKADVGQLGLALFLPLTWYYVFSGNLKVSPIEPSPSRVS